MVFTGQVFADESNPDAASQAGAALKTLEATLLTRGSDLARVARLSAYVADDAAVAAVDALVAERFAAAPVAFTLVRTPLARSGARVAFEAVAASSQPVAKVTMAGPDAAVMPAGGKIFISGQAEKGPDLASAMRLTMAGLFRSLTHLGLTKAEVVQVKAFIRPFGEHAAAVREVAASFDGGPVPPVVVMEWQSELFAEIELVVSAKSLPSPVGDTVAYSWLPWLTKSPRYCNVCQVAAGTPLIFVGAVSGGDTGDGRAQWKVAFERLGSVLFEAGGSYRNLVKATYYLGDPGARTALGDIRGVYFDPTRPPAASALGVAGFGRPGRVVTVELIAVPVK
ncbi:MAG: Rid family hydrolase [Verrucomicrobia bacterium]|nr:Rid family hydrolase [Verrucomicrobiota bacterium]